MRKIYLVLLFGLFLSGCSSDEDNYSEKEQMYTFEDIQFESDFWNGDDALIDTKELTIVAPMNDLRFIKHQNETTLKVVTTFYEGEKSITRPEKYILFVNEKEMKEISKKYSNKFQSTIEFSEE